MSEQHKVYAAAVRFIALRPRSRREADDYLVRKGYALSDIAAVLSELTEIGLLNDQAFAQTWVANRLALRPRSRKVLRLELEQKGVPAHNIEAALGEFDGETELQQLIGVIQRKQKLPQYRSRDKLVEYLARQGYTYEVIKKALTRLKEASFTGPQPQDDRLEEIPPPTGE
jgi:regulatory protein